MSKQQDYMPNFTRVNGIEIVEPDEHFPIGQYLTMGPGHGIMFPSVPLGPKGTKMAEALDATIAFVAKMQEDANNRAASQIPMPPHKPFRNEGGSGDVQEAAPQENSNIGFTAMLAQANGPIISFFRAGLEVNYSKQTTDWIVDNFHLQLGTIAKLIQAAQGEVVEEAIFRSQS
jgi:hypothetical protein